MSAALAMAPILAVVALMLGRGWTAAWAGLIGLILAVAIARTAFDLAPDQAQGDIVTLAGGFAEASFTTATILWIVFPALAIHALQTRTGAIETIRGRLATVSDEPVVAVLLIGWFFALFMEGSAGFGVPVALAAPLLVGLGLPPERALAVALIGHAAAVSFGAVGTPIVPLVAASGLDGATLAVWPALLHGSLGWILMASLLRALGARGAAAWKWGAIATLVFFVPFVATAVFVGPELPSLFGALFGGSIFVAFVLRTRSTAGASSIGSRCHRVSFARAAVPYLVLVALIALTRLVPPLAEALRDIALEWAWRGRFFGSFAPLYHPGTMLLLAFGAGALLQQANWNDVTGALRDAAKRLAPVTLALLAMLCLARVLVHAGMIEALASAAADATGHAWPLVAPFVGVLGTFVTGSATASNILFAELQLSVAKELNLSPIAILGAQAFGAAVGNIVCPHNIVAGAATVGVVGREGIVLRRTVPVCLVYAATGGLLVWATL